jgi:hypothetical protein
LSVRRCLALVVAGVLFAVALPATASTSSAGAWVRVTFTDRITDVERDAVEAAGLGALQYVPTHSYLAYGSQAAADAAARVPGVASVRPVTPREKVASALGGRSGVVPVAVTAAALDNGLSARLAELGTVRGRFDPLGDGAIAVTEALVDAGAARALGTLPQVLSVGLSGRAWETEDEGSAQVLAGNVVEGQPTPGYESFLAELGIDGSGVTMSVVDDGIDDTHPEFTGRVQRLTYGPGTQGPAEGHGTHVAGIVGGKGATVGPMRVRDGDGLLYGVGVAPGVTLIDQPAIQLTNTVGPTGDFPPEGGFEVYTRDAVRAGAVGWNASWTDGGGVGVGYNANAAQLDALTRDADFETGGGQPFTFVFSAGNSGSGGGKTSRITSPKEAKNIIAVAASRSHRAGDVDRVASFSSRGPARDGRVVPTVTAPGETIVSARASTGVLCTLPLSGVNDAPPADGFTLYTGCSGTSMAAPHVAGAVALIHDWWRERNGGADSSPAMDRALLINSATDLGRRDIPNRDEGWGRVNLRALFDPATARVLVDQSVVLTDLDAAHSLTLAPADPSRPLRVTVVWTDPAGAVGGEEDRALVNDLDLTVTAADGSAYRGNNFVKGVSRTGGQADRVNNVENVFLDAPAGTYQVDVAAFNLPADGAPGGDETDQDFALVLTNAVVVQ